MRKLVFPLLCLLVFSGCQRKPVAVVNGEEISGNAFDHIVKERLKQHQTRGAKADMGALKRAVLDQVIVEKLMVQASKEKNVAVTDAEVAAEIEAVKRSMGEDVFKRSLREDSLSMDEYKKIVRDRMTASRFMDALVPADSISEKEIAKYYKESPTPFLKPESVNVRFIQTDTVAGADAVLAELKNKKTNFDALAERLSEEKKAVISEYGWTSPGYFSPDIAAALTEIKEGRYGGPYQGRDGYYIFRVKKRQRQRPKSLAEARDEIRALLLEERLQATVAHWAATRRSAATIVINLRT